MELGNGRALRISAAPAACTEHFKKISHCRMIAALELSTASLPWLSGATLEDELFGRHIVAVCAGVLLAVGSVKAESGIASVYAYSGGRTASGQQTDPGGLTAAHRTLPFGTMVQVTNRRNGKSVTVRINDRGPFVRGRVIDVSPAAARALGFSGLAPVTLARAN